MTKKRSSEILADENREIFPQKVKFRTFSTESDNFYKMGGNLKQGECILGNLGSYPGSLDRATGEIVTEFEVSRVFRGTDNRQSDLGSWGPSTARESRPKGDITSLTSLHLPPVFRPSFSYSLFFHFSKGLEEG